MSDSLAFLVDDGWIALLALAALAVEFVVLTVRAPSESRLKRSLDVFFALSPGACLTFALYAALMGWGAFWVVAFISASFPLHLIDLTRRQ